MDNSMVLIDIIRMVGDDEVIGNIQLEKPLVQLKLSVLVKLHGGNIEEIHTTGAKQVTYLPGGISVIMPRAAVNHYPITGIDNPDRMFLRPFQYCSAGADQLVIDMGHINNYFHVLLSIIKGRYS